MISASKKDGNKYGRQKGGEMLMELTIDGHTARTVGQAVTVPIRNGGSLTLHMMETNGKLCYSFVVDCDDEPGVVLPQEVCEALYTIEKQMHGSGVNIGNGQRFAVKRGKGRITEEQEADPGAEPKIRAVKRR